MENARFSLLLDAFLEELLSDGRRSTTVENYRYLLREFIDFLAGLGCTGPVDVTESHIRQWMIHKRQQNLSEISVHNCYRIPRRFWRWCLENEFANRDPFLRVSCPPPKVQIKRALTDEQIRVLLKVCEGKCWTRKRDRAIVLFLLGTGLRLTEAQALTVADSKQQSVLVRHGKHGKQRIVPVPSQARLAIMKYLIACPFQPGDEDPLWWGTRGALTRDGFQQVVRDIGERAGLKLGPHMFRHTFATRMLAAGASMEHVRLLMGHSDYTVLRNYLHLVERDLQETVQKFNPLNRLG